MDRDGVIKAITELKEALGKAGITVQQIILFGSCARGEYKEGCDIDLIVISNDFETKSYWERIETLADAVSAIYEPVEALAVTAEEWKKGDSFLVEFARDGEVFTFDNSSENT